MAQFIRLARLTDQGVRNVRGLQAMLGEAREIMEREGARLASAWVTLGPYDIVAVVEAPDERAMAKASALIASKGNFTAQTLAAVPVADFVASLGSGG